MEDGRVWAFEESLWRATDAEYKAKVDPDCVMALSHAPWIHAGPTAVEAVSDTPPWDEVAFSDPAVRRPEEGLIVIGHRVAVAKGETRFAAACTSVYRRLGHDDWTVVRHAQVALPESA